MNIPSVKVPTYTMTLPHSQKEVKFRPYVVKEEKLLILAKDSNDKKMMTETVIDIIKNCTFNEIDAETAPLFDVQYAFLQIRSKSVGETLDITSKCRSCSQETNITLKLDDFALKTTPGHTNKLQLDSDFIVVMNYPTLKHFTALSETKNDEETYNVIAECIDTIYSNEEVFKNGPGKTKEFRTFIDELTVKQFEKLESFFLTMPVLHKNIEYDCAKCQTHNLTHIDGITNFFV